MKLFREVIGRIRSDNENGKPHYWIGMGDMGEYIFINDPRFTVDNVPKDERAHLKDMIGRQVDMVANELKPIAPWSLGCLEGNHEEKLTNRIGHDLHDRMCQKAFPNLRKANLTYSAIVNVRFNRVTGKTDSKRSSTIFKVFAHHGAGGGKKTGGTVNRVEDMVVIAPYCDAYFMGHVHRRYANIIEGLDCRVDSEILYSRPRAVGVTGAFKKSYEQGFSSYAERLQLSPTSLGVITFGVVPRSHRHGYEGLLMNAYCRSDGLPG